MKTIKKTPDSSQIAFSNADGSVISSAMRNENGIIEVTITKPKRKLPKSEFQRFLYLALSFLFIGIFVWMAMVDVIPAIFYLIPSGFFVIRMIVSIIPIMKDTKMVTSYKAEHMVHVAYMALKRLPTLDEVGQYSKRISLKRIIPSLVKGLIKLIGFVFSLTSFYKLIIVKTFKFGTSLVTPHIWPGSPLGIISTLWFSKKPTYQDIEVAIAALDGLLKLGI